MGPTLRELRKQAGKSCAEVAQALGVTERTVYRYESGERRLDILQVVPLADLYEVFVLDIIDAQIETLKVSKTY